MARTEKETRMMTVQKKVVATSASNYQKTHHQKQCSSLQTDRNKFRWVEDDAEMRTSSSSSSNNNNEKNTSSSCGRYDTEVVVIGNGPSAICLSYFLSGHWPHYKGLDEDECVHPDSSLHARLMSAADASGRSSSLVEQDLRLLSDGIEGRSSNPVALLFDALSNPEADVGGQLPSFLRWTFNPDRRIPHVVLGKRRTGGIWQVSKTDEVIEGQTKTVSLGSWMEMPDMSFEKWLKDVARSSSPGRATTEDISDYYRDYVERKDLKEFFRDHVTVTSVDRVDGDGDRRVRCVDCESGEQVRAGVNDVERRDETTVWEVCGYQTVHENGRVRTHDFRYTAPTVVLATGTYDMPNSLNVPGEDLPYVFHSLSELERRLRSVTAEAGYEDPVVVIGAGLSAADVVLSVRSLNLPVVHIFRRTSSAIYRQLPAAVYPEYHEVYRLMESGETDDDGLYKSYPDYDVVEFTDDQKVIVRCKKTGNKTVLKASLAVVLIGTRSDLTFLSPTVLKTLCIVQDVPIHAKYNPVSVDPYTYESSYHPGLYALGPLVGDSFVRFLRGGALGITSRICQKRTPSGEQR